MAAVIQNPITGSDNTFEETAGSVIAQHVYNLNPGVGGFTGSTTIFDKSGTDLYISGGIPVNIQNASISIDVTVADYVSVTPSGTFYVTQSGVGTGSQHVVNFPTSYPGSVAITSSATLPVSGEKIQVYPSGTFDAEIGNTGSVRVSNTFFPGSVFQATDPWIVLGSARVVQDSVDRFVYQVTIPWEVTGSVTNYGVGSTLVTNTGSVIIASSVDLFAAGSVYQVTTPWEITGSVATYDVGSVLITNTGSVIQANVPWITTGSTTPYGVGSMLITNTGSVIVTPQYLGTMSGAVTNDVLTKANRSSVTTLLSAQAFSGGNVSTKTSSSVGCGSFTRFGLYTSVLASGQPRQFELQVEFSDDDSTWYDYTRGPFGAMLWEYTATSGTALTQCLDGVCLGRFFRVTGTGSDTQTGSPFTVTAKVEFYR